MAEAGSPKPVAAFDLDGTFFRRQLLELLFDTSFSLGLFPGPTQAMYEDLAIDFRDRKIRHAEYDAALVHMFDENIRGKRVQDVRAVAKRLARDHHDWVYTFTRSLYDRVVATHERITITGAVKEVVEEIVRYWPFVAAYTTELTVKAGKYTGKTHLIHANDKAQALRAHVMGAGAPYRDSIAIGDTENDIPMLGSVERPVAFNPNEELARVAEERAWPIVIERKDCIYVVRNASVRRFFIDDADGAVAHALGIDDTSP